MELDFTVRLAKHEDALSILSIRNAPAVRQVCFDGAEINKEQHLQWFSNVLNDDNRWLLVACNRIDGEVIGVVRYDRLVQSRDIAEVSIYLSQTCIGRGVGSKILCACQEWLQSNTGDLKYIKARVKADNARSRRFFENSQFQLDSYEYYKELEQK